MKPPLLLDTEAIAWHYDVAPGTIRSWSRRDKWTPYGTRRHRYWNLYEAQASYDQRYPDSKIKKS